ncbi:MAG: hypothetical protein ABIY62_01525, partial [Ginsengibacter sp.]
MSHSNPVNIFYRLIKNKPTVPRWIIFLLDLGICAFSLFYAYLLRFNMNFDEVVHFVLIVPILVVTSLNIIFFRVFRTYEGIIRLSSAQEGLRCVSAVFCGSLVLAITIIISSVFSWSFIVPMSVLFIYFFVASFLIFAYRILIKELYNRSLKVKFTAENVIVLGKTNNGALLKNAIESIPGHQYKVVGFVDENEKLWGKSIDKAKIYSWEQVKLNALKFHTKFIFLASDDMGIELKNEIVDFCLNANIVVKVIPAVQKWV